MYGYAVINKLVKYNPLHSAPLFKWWVARVSFGTAVIVIISFLGVWTYSASMGLWCDGSSGDDKHHHHDKNSTRDAVCDALAINVAYCLVTAALGSFAFVSLRRIAGRTGITPDGQPLQAILINNSNAAAAGAGVTAAPVAGPAAGGRTVVLPHATVHLHGRTLTTQEQMQQQAAATQAQQHAVNRVGQLEAQDMQRAQDDYDAFNGANGTVNVVPTNNNNNNNLNARNTAQLDVNVQPYPQAIMQPQTNAPVPMYADIGNAQQQQMYAAQPMPQLYQYSGRQVEMYPSHPMPSAPPAPQVPNAGQSDENGKDPASQL